MAVMKAQAIVALEEPQDAGEVEAVEQPAALGAQERCDRVPGEGLEAGVAAQALAVDRVRGAIPAGVGGCIVVAADHAGTGVLVGGAPGRPGSPNTHPFCISRGDLSHKL